MNDTDLFLDKIKAGFATLDLNRKYKDSALKWIRVWMTEPEFKDYVPQIEFLAESGKWEFLLDSFYQVIPFGTGGRRGPVGIGPNRINIWTIQASAQGHCQYLIKKYGEKAKEKGVVLAYDVRKFSQKGIYNDEIPNPVMNLGCRDLAIAAARVYGANGIKVYIFDGVRSTPELSFAIRHLKAISGDVFSASHNPPTDNGKKIYDEFGGQLIPPHDQILVDEVTQNVSEIKTLPFDDLVENGLVEYIGEKVDEAYYRAVCDLSLSRERGVKILYSPLHGTGLTSLYPSLKKLGFDVTHDPATSNMSGAFENVTFNIPNPEVVESFGVSIPAADKAGADIILSTDPDADRIGVMVKQKGRWKFLNGNEIGILLADYAISRYRAAGKLCSQSIIIKTLVTSVLIEKIAKENNVKCISDLLVGFKYIAHEMNLLEDKGIMDHFLMGLEESHGYIAGNYVRDKDAASAAVWISELASILKNQGKTLVDQLENIYATYGYCHNYLTEIRLLGAKGMEQISLVMNYLRNEKIKKAGQFIVEEKTDRLDGPPHVSKTDTSSRNVLIFHIKNLPETESIKITVRPSGTEPKLKIYFEILGKPFAIENPEQAKEDIVNIRKKLERAFMGLCYKILDIDFPDRGFLLFWQLPVYDKLKYFEIEPEIEKLKEISGKEKRKEKLEKLLSFLGSNPIKKVDDAFKEKYRKGIAEYLDLRE